MHVGVLGELSQGLVTMQGGRGDLGLELRGMVAAGSTHGLPQAGLRQK